MSIDLSPRERETIARIADGKTTKEIAAELSIAESTVNWHVSNALSKLGASTRAEAVAIALRGDVRPIRADPTERLERPAAVRPWPRILALGAGVLLVAGFGVVATARTLLVTPALDAPVATESPLATQPPIESAAPSAPTARPSVAPTAAPRSATPDATGAAATRIPSIAPSVLPTLPPLPTVTLPPLPTITPPVRR